MHQFYDTTDSLPFPMFTMWWNENFKRLSKFRRTKTKRKQLRTLCRNENFAKSLAKIIPHICRRQLACFDFDSTLNGLVASFALICKLFRVPYNKVVSKKLAFCCANLREKVPETKCPACLRSHPIKILGCILTTPHLLTSADEVCESTLGIFAEPHPLDHFGSYGIQRSKSTCIKDPDPAGIEGCELQVTVTAHDSVTKVYLLLVSSTLSVDGLRRRVAAALYHSDAAAPRLRISCAGRVLGHGDTTLGLLGVATGCHLECELALRAGMAGTSSDQSRPTTGATGLASPSTPLAASLAMCLAKARGMRELVSRMSRDALRPEAARRGPTLPIARPAAVKCCIATSSDGPPVAHADSEGAHPLCYMRVAAAVPPTRMPTAQLKRRMQIQQLEFLKAKDFLKANFPHSSHIRCASAPICKWRSLPRNVSLNIQAYFFDVDDVNVSLMHTFISHISELRICTEGTAECLQVCKGFKVSRLKILA